MRHRRSGIKIGRTTSHRQAMFRNMVTSLFKYERIQTTDTKAKELRRWADHVITLAKRGDLHARRQVLSIMREKNVVHKLFEEAQERFGKLNGGYTRIIKIGRRPGDSAPVSLIELVTYEEKTKKSKKKPKAAGKTKVASEAPKETVEKKDTEAEVSAEASDKAAPTGEAATESAEAAPAEAAEEVKAQEEPETAAEADAPKVRRQKLILQNRLKRKHQKSNKNSFYQICTLGFPPD